MTYKTGAGLILLAGLIWSSQGLLLRQITLAESWTVMAWRSVGLIATLALYVNYRTKGHLWAALGSVGRSGVLGALGLVLAFGGAIYALQATTIASAVVLFAAAPFFAALIGWAALGEKVAPQTWAAIAAAIVGIAVMVGGQIDMRAIWGNIAALICAFGFGAFTVSLRAAPQRLRPDVGHFPIVLLGGILSVMAGAVLAWAIGQDLTPPLPEIGLSMFMGAFTLAGGMILFTFGTRAVTAAAATLLAQIEVILGPLWVWLVMGEAFSRATAIGGGIVLAALVFNVLATRGREPDIAIRP
jgi:drug/metabolite transporter (DMT)-like permease